MFCRKTIALVWALAEAGLVTAVPAAAARPHNVVLFIPDGLRALVVSPGSAPAMAAIRDPSVWKEFRATQPNAPIIAHGMNNSNHLLPLGRGSGGQKRTFAKS